MAKWLVGAGVALVILLIVIWRQLGESEATPAVEVKQRVAAPEVVAVAPDVKPAPAPSRPAEPAKVAKLDPNSDEFHMAYSEMQTPHASRKAVKCYDDYVKAGGRPVHRNQSIVLGIKSKIVDGKVTFDSVWVKRSSITRSIDDRDQTEAGFHYDTALEACFLQAVRSVEWVDPRLPDQPLEEDEITLSPERGLKKYREDNINYVGAEGPQWGADGKPINKPEHTGAQEHAGEKDPKE